MLTATDKTGTRTITLELVPGVPVRIGRLPDNGLSVAWDLEVSRQHAEAVQEGDILRVACLPTARNPILFLGSLTRELSLRSGQCFQLGQTTFQFTYRPPEPVFEVLPPADEGDVEELSYRADDLKQFSFENMTRQMALLTDLPGMMSTAGNDAELGHLLAGLLLEAIPGAVAVAVAHYEEADIKWMQAEQLPGNTIIKPPMMRIQTREDYEGRFMPSRRLVGRALKENVATVHVWDMANTSGRFTMTESLDWAFCVPVDQAASKGWCLYVSGKGSQENAAITRESIEPDVRFTQLLAQFIGAYRRVRHLQETQTQLASFFSPKVMESLTAGASQAMTPSERNITVLFCDVRGFSRKSEQHKNDLLYLLQCVKEALGVMTQGILKYDGTIADFQGDAALGFWGWPGELAEGAIPACLAALAIQDEFNHPERHGGFLDGFSVGLGVAHGRAVAGQIGTSQQAKIGVFGPVVNQGSRIEGLTRQFGVSICIDEQTAYFAENYFKADRARVRRLARIRPKGMDTAITVSELLPPFAGTESAAPSAQATVKAGFLDDRSSDKAVPLSGVLLSNDHLAQYEEALDLVIAGKWDLARVMLNALGTEGPIRFLKERMTACGNTPPPDWDGAFSLSEK